MRNKKGLTIIECLLSIIILAVMLTAGMAFYFNAQAGLRWSVHKRIAVELANSELESIKNIGYNGLTTDCPGVGLCNNPNYTKPVQVEDLPLPPPTQPNQKVYVIDNGGYKEVHVEIAWQEADKSNPSTVNLSTYIAL